MLSYLTDMKRNYIGDGQKEKNENAKQYYYECKEKLQKIYKLCKEDLQQEECARLKKEQQYWEEGIEKRLVQNIGKAWLEICKKQWRLEYRILKNYGMEIIIILIKQISSENGGKVAIV